MRLRYTTRAVAELDEILTFIDGVSPQGSRRVKIRIQTIVNFVLRYPEAGKLTSKSRLRRVVVRPYPYLIFYRVEGEELVVHGIRHGARRPATMPK